MKRSWTRRTGYLLAAVLLLVIEVLIALFVQDAFLRPYGGDVLVTVLLCCLVRAVLGDRPRLMPLYVFLFAAAVELSQAAGLASHLPAGAAWDILRIALGSTFSYADLLCYAVGCALFAAAERYLGWKAGK